MNNNYNSNTDKLVVWTSKLGNKYPLARIEEQHKDSMHELMLLRHQGANRFCAECGDHDGNVWSSVNLGVFTCLRCGSLHRALGTHVSKPKGCQGSYLWVSVVTCHPSCFLPFGSFDEYSHFLFVNLVGSRRVATHARNRERACRGLVRRH